MLIPHIVGTHRNFFPFHPFHAQTADVRACVQCWLVQRERIRLIVLAVSEATQSFGEFCNSEQTCLRARAVLISLVPGFGGKSNALWLWLAAVLGSVASALAESSEPCRNLPRGEVRGGHTAMAETDRN